MATVVSQGSRTTPESSTRRADALAGRLEQGARALGALASALGAAEWQARIPRDGRPIGNSAAAAAAIRSLGDAELDRAATVSLNADAPLTCQFFLEDHAVRHSYHHFARIRAALEAFSG